MCNNHNTRIFNESIELKSNAMLKVRPELFYEWDFEKNDELGLDIYNVTKGSGKVAWWKCSVCGSPYDKEIFSKVLSNHGCPYCSGQRVNHTNSLANLNPEIASEWHPTKNGDLTPHDVTCGSNKEVWWQCKKHENHKWKAQISQRTNSKGCPYCSGHKLLKGFNDIWTTNPELAKLLADPEDGYKYMQGAVKKVNWKCPDCGGIIKDRVIYSVKQNGLSCPHCSDGKSYPEKVIYYLLKQIGIDFEWEKTFDWIKGKRYDFYLPDYNMIIEVNGRQHYERGFETFGGRGLKEECDNDKLKERTAKENGIEKYIIIDASYSEIEYIKTNVINSELSKFFILSDVNWKNINKESLSSLIMKVITLWNEGLDVLQISNKIGLDRLTIRNYLKKGNASGLCNYDGKKELIEKRSTKCIQLSLNGDYIRDWNSIKSASTELSIRQSGISSCCRGINKTSGGYKWMYKEDYDKLISNKN